MASGIPGRIRGLAGDLLQDLVHGLRRLAKRPGISVVSIGILALGLSASTAVFTYINAFFQPFPGTAADGVLRLHRATEESPFGPVSYPDYLDLVALEDGPFRGIEGVSNGFAASARHEELTEVVFGQAVTGDLFALLDIAMARGRGLGVDDDRPGSPPAVVISHAYWTERYGNAEDAVGRTLFLNNDPYTIVGVAGPEFLGTSSARRPHVWLPFEQYKRVYWARSETASDREARVISPFVRLRDGVSAAQASARVSAATRGLDAVAPLEAGPRRFLLDGATWIDPNTRIAELPTARIMLAAAVGLLLLACVNVANLMLAMGTRRRREVAMRAAIGASRGRLLRQLLTESLLYGLIAGIIALALAGPAADWIGSFFARPSVWGSNVPRDVRLDGAAFAFAAVAAILTGTITGMLPALRGSRRDLVTSLRETPGGAAAASGLGLRDLLVSVQVALSLVLLVAAALVVRTLESASSIDPGFRTDAMVASYVSTSSIGTPPEERHRFYRELAQRLEALPWVEAVAVADYAPLSPHAGAEVRADDADAPVQVTVAKVVPGYFETLGIRLVSGRTFESTDTAAGSPVVIVDRTLGERLFGSEDPLNRVIRWTAPLVEGEQSSEIVGVVENTRLQTLMGEVENQLYISYPQHYSTPGNAVLVATNGSGSAAVPLLEAEYRAVDRRLAVVNVLPYSEVLRGFLYTQRMNAELFTVVALLGLVLAAAGIFGVVNLAVSQRTKEIGIRIAIGAARGNIASLVVKRVVAALLLGLALGGAGALVAVRWTQSLLFGVEPGDPTSFAVAVVALGGAAALAVYLPTRRALSVDPVRSLRTE